MSAHSWEWSQNKSKNGARSGLSWKEKEILGIGSELKVSVNAGFEKLKAPERPTEKRVLVLISQRDKLIGECLCLVSILFNRDGVVNGWKSCISRKSSFRRDNWFYLVRKTPYIYYISNNVPIVEFSCHTVCNLETNYQNNRRSDSYRIPRLAGPSKKPFRAFSNL